MRFEHEGMVLWYDTPDAPAPGDTVPVAATTDRAVVTISVGVQPPSASNSVSLRYSVNGGPPQTMAAEFLRHDVHQKAQYFAARLPALQAGDKIDYIAISRAPGRQVPSPEQAAKFASSFSVTAAGQKPTPSERLAEAILSKAVTATTPGSAPARVTTPAPHPATPAASALSTGPALAERTAAPTLPSTTPAPAPTGLPPGPRIQESPVTGRTTLRLSPDALNRTVLDHVMAEGGSTGATNELLNTALKAKLATAATNAGQNVLVNLVHSIPSVDIAADKDLSVRDFVSTKLMPLADPSAKAAAETAIANLSTKTTVGDLLGLNTAVKDNPLFANEVKKVDLATLIKTSAALSASPQLIDDFINRYATFKGSAPDFWKSLSADNEFKAVVPELQLTLQLGALTLDNPTFVSALRANYPQMKSPHDLTSLCASDWQQLVTSQNIPVPATIPESTPAEKVTNYVNSILRTLKGAFPGHYFAHGLKQLVSQSKDPIDQDVNTFLNNATDFDVLKTNITAYVKQNGQTAFKGIDPAQQTAVTLKIAAWQRVSRVAADFPTANTLMTAGFRSAYSIASTPQTTFIQRFSSQLGGTARATEIHSKAQQRTARGLNLFTNIRQALGGASPRVIGEVRKNLRSYLNSESSGIPNWQELFGSLSYCSCEDCRSVYSAAGYFVDLLQFLGSSPTNPTNPVTYTDPLTGKTKTLTALDVLIGNKDANIAGRRPDLPYIKLNCENTNTPLPYVDLVNEILETLVVESASANPPTATLDKAAAHDTPSDATADELGVNPEYTKDDAYNLYLSTAIYPPTLPFDRWLETARTYLEFLGSSLHEVMSTFQKGADPSNIHAGTPSGIALACEYLKISEAECTILTGLDFSGNPPTPAHNIWESYGYGKFVVACPNVASSGFSLKSWERCVAQVPEFLQRTGITYHDLVELLKTRFLNPNQSIMLQAPADPVQACDLTQTTLVDLSVTDGTLQDATLNYMHRFIRLWRKLGWPISDLDKTIMALGKSDIGQQLLVSLATVKQLQSQLNVPLALLLSFWANIDTDGRDSLYLSLFQNKAVLNPPDSAFQLTYNATLANAPTVSFPSPLFPNLEFSPSVSQLTLKGSMSSDEHSQLLKLSTGAYTKAINNLYTQSLAGGTPSYSVSPFSPPQASLHSAAPFLRYDVDHSQLTITGAMTDAQRAQLNFSNDQPYLTAVDSLYKMRTLLPGTELATATSSQPALISDHINAILAALQISADDLTAIGALTGLYNTGASPAWAPLSLANLSMLYRYALLAQALGVSVRDLISLMTLMGAGPGSPSYAFASPTAILAFVQSMQKVQASPFSVAQLNYLYRDLYDPNAGIAPLPANVSLLLTTLQTGLAKIAHDNAVVPDPKGDLLRKKLGTLLGGKLADAAMALTNGTGVYSTPLAPLPGIVLPSFITYDPAAQQLSMTVAMTKPQQAQLLALSSDPAYQAAINGLYTNSQTGGTAIYTQPLTPLLSITFPALPQGVISYDGVAHRLSFIGPMTAADQTALLALSGEANYTAAIQTLYGNSAAGIFSAALAALPAGVTLPQGVISYDSAAHELNFTGVMSDADLTALLALSADANYTAAIQTLYSDGMAGIFSAPLVALPGIVLPAFVTYSAQQLSINGAMTPAQEAQLLSLSTDPSYQKAISSLHTKSQAGAASTHTQPLAALPSITFPVLPHGAISYEGAAQQLRFTGPMSTANEAALLALSADVNYQVAIQSLRQQSIDFISAELAAFLSPSDVSQLIENAQVLTAAERIAFVMRKLMPYLRETLSKSYIKQTLSDNLQLDPKLTNLLVGTILKSQANPADPKTREMADFLALVGDGLSASYFPNKTLSGPPALSRIDPTVNFNWGFGLPDSSISARPFSVRWSGFVFPQYTETYGFYVRAGGAITFSVDRQQLINQQNDQPPAESSCAIGLTAGQLYQIELDWQVNTASAVVELSWSSPSTPKAIIPQSQLFSGASFNSLAPIVNSYTLVYKAALLANTFRMAADDVAYLYDHGQDFAGVDPTDPTNQAKFAPFDPNLLPLDPSAFKPALFNQWERLNVVFNFRNSLPAGDVGLLNVFSVASASTTPSTLSGSTTQAVLQATGWDSGELQTLTGAAGFGLADQDFNNEAGTEGTGLVRLQACIALVSRLGVSSEQLFTWANFAPDPALEEGIGKDIQNTVKAKYDEQTWVTVGKPLNHRIREHSKEALIAYILANAVAWGMTAPDGGGPITTSDQLYEYFLIDVDMSPCMLTSRIVQANAAIQLFVQRCLMNLESAVSPSAFAANVWEWMKNYRVWEANRMVFLYPENWIEPELRDDKSPFFKELESELLQNEITPDNVEQAYLNYLNKLDTVARLDVRGMYWQLDTNSAAAPDGTPDATNDVLHVFARTKHSPYTYYYRRLLNCSQYGVEGGGSIWTPWEKVDVGIEGDHLIPVVWNRRLYLFWPMFKETADPTVVPPSFSISSSGGSYSPSAPLKTLELRLAWSEYKQGGWLPKQVTADPALNPLGFGPPDGVSFTLGTTGLDLRQEQLDTTKFTFGADIDDITGALLVFVYHPDFLWYYPAGFGKSPSYLLGMLGQFVFSGCQGGVSISTPVLGNQPYIGPLFVTPQNTGFDGMALDEWSPPQPASDQYAETLTVPTLFWSTVGIGNDVVLHATPTIGSSPLTYTLMFPQQFIPYLYSYSVDILSGDVYTEPFFYQDGQRAYFVTEPLLPVSVQLAEAKQTRALYSPQTLFTSELVGDISHVFDREMQIPSHLPRAIVGDIARGLTKGTGSSLTTTRSALSASPRATTALGNRMSPSPARERAATASNGTTPQTFTTSYLFSTFFHPHVCAFIKALNCYGVPGLLTLANQELSNDGGVLSGFVLSTNPSGPVPGLTPGILVAENQLYETNIAPKPGIAAEDSALTYLFYHSPGGFYYSSTSMPNTAGDAFIGTVTTNDDPAVVSVTGSTAFEQQYSPDQGLVSPYGHPRENVDFSFDGAYSLYNWELFFHIPLLIATRLRQNQKFEEAQRWFHYIFNPVTNSTDPPPQRYWNFLPFYECSPWDQIAGQIQYLVTPPSSGGPPSFCGQDIGSQIVAWTNKPFDPHLIARMRTVAYRMKVVMAYLDNLIAWGDFLFGQNTRESINEATQIYVLAKEILGPRPVMIPARGTIQDYTYNDLVTLYKLDDFSNALVQMENDFPFLSTAASSGSAGQGAAYSMGSTAFYFCFPPNDKLLAYWDTVEDRLYKIRHCMNIAGQVEQLPLFAPPISPALLVQAEAMGIDLSSVLANINAGSPHYRFTFMVHKALELCAEVRSFGAALLAALEKKDAEALSLLRATEETSLLQAMQQMKQSQVDEANANVAALQASQAVTQNRQSYYQGLISGGLSGYEQQHLSELGQALIFQEVGQGAALLGSQLALLPDVSLGLAGFGGTPTVTLSFGGRQLTAATELVSRISEMLGTLHTFNANLASILGWVDRRAQDWGFQLQTATLELAQIAQQIAVANLRVQIAQDDQANLDLQVQNAQAVEDFLRSKYTNADLYDWMIDQTSTVYFQCYQMAYDLASRAEAAFRVELGLTDSNYIQFGYWDSLKKGLLSGERLYLDLKRMELAYLEQNVREYEITKNISLVLFDPLALIALKETGQCFVTLPEAYFNMDYPAHYMRRITSVSLTIPCVTGPYTSVNCTLTLLNSKIRIDNVASSLQDYASDSHFITNFAATQSIATSGAQNDSGMFEVNFRDERYLPFEGAGVISTWQIDLPLDTNAFDFGTISDVVINLKYTARDGGATLAKWAKQAAVMPAFSLQGGPADSSTPFPDQTNLARLFRLKHEFPSEWYKFLNPPDTATSQSMQIALNIERFPFQYRGKKIAISRVELFLKFKDLHDPTTYTHDGTPLGDYAAGTALAIYLAPPNVTLQGPNGTLASAPTFLDGLPFAAITLSGTPPGLGNWTLTAQNADIQKIPASLQNMVTSGGKTFNHLNPDPIDDIVIVCHYSAK